jgi:hypothetical protein
MDLMLETKNLENLHTYRMKVKPALKGAFKA